MSDMDSSFLGKFRLFLFKNKFAKKDSHPKWQGRVVFTAGQVHLLEERVKGMADTDEIECETAGWVKKDRNGDDYIFGSSDTAKKEVVSADNPDIPF